MSAMHLVALYAGVNLLIAFCLSVQTIRMRLKHQIVLGDGDNTELLRASRAHGNNAEYTPFVLVALLILQVAGASLTWIHVVGGLLTAGRLLHGIGMNTGQDPNKARQLGMLLTWFAMLAAIVALLASAL